MTSNRLKLLHERLEEIESLRNDIVTAILKRIGEQPEFKKSWKNMLNAERSYLCGDIYNIIYTDSTEPRFNSTDLLLLANDEWKRREERKHNHENIPWCAGFINGFLTDKKWARDCIDRIQKDGDMKHE